MVMLSPTLIFNSSIQFFGKETMYVDPPLSCILRVCFAFVSVSNYDLFLELLIYNLVKDLYSAMIIS